MQVIMDQLILGKPAVGDHPAGDPIRDISKHALDHGQPSQPEIVAFIGRTEHGRNVLLHFWPRCSGIDVDSGIPRDASNELADGVVVREVGLAVVMFIDDISDGWPAPFGHRNTTGCNEHSAVEECYLMTERDLGFNEVLAIETTF